MNKLALFIMTILLAFFGCAPKQEGKLNEIQLNADELIEARALFQTHCYACHTPRGNQDDRVAPPMIAIKRHYITDQTTQAQFIADVSTYVVTPRTDISKMPDAVRKFGMMVPLQVPKDDLKKIATFIYQQDIEAPDWFEAHYKEEHGKQDY